MNKAPYVRVGDYNLIKHFDHEDITTEFHNDWVLAVVANLLAAFGVFALLMCAAAFLLQVPSSWITWLVLEVWGL